MVGLVGLAGLLFWSGGGCGEQTQATPDGGIAPPSGRDALVVPDVFVPQPPQESCDATDLFAQRDCGLGRRCVMLGGAFKCADAGDVASYSPCTMDQNTGLDDCAGGSLCEDPLGTGQSLCLPYCKGRWTACPRGVCAGDTKHAELTNLGIFLCVPDSSCDPTAPSASCPPGQTCVWDPRFGGATLCVPDGSVGSGAENDSCRPDATSLPCGPGLTCVAVVQGDEKCAAVCRLATGTDCGTNGQCVYVGDDTYGYCAKN